MATQNSSSVSISGGTVDNVTLVTPSISSIINTGTLTLPNQTDTLVGRATTDVLTNKTLTSPVMTTPSLGVASATSINKVAITAPATGATLTIADGATLTASATATVSGTNTGDQTISITGDVTASGSTGVLTSTVTKVNGTSLAGLATGILKNTTGTGVPSIAVSGSDYAPATSGNSILYGNSAGGFSNVTIGSGVDFTGGTLSATGSGGTVTSVSVTTANGVSGTVTNPTTTPAISLTLGAITPTSVSSGSGAFSSLSVSGNSTFTGQITSPSNVAGAGSKLLIQGSSGTGQAGASGGNGHIEILGAGATSLWTTFSGPLQTRRRGGILMQTGTAAGDASATFVTGSLFQLVASNGTNNGTTAGNGGTLIFTAGLTTAVGGGTIGGSSITLGGGSGVGTAGGVTISGGVVNSSTTTASAGNVSIIAGAISNALSTSVGASVLITGGSNNGTNKAGNVEITGGEYNGSLTVSAGDVVIAGGRNRSSVAAVGGNVILIPGASDIGVPGKVFVQDTLGSTCLTIEREKAYFFSNGFYGNVGIGTSSPSKSLDIVGQFRACGAAASGYALLEYGTSATATNNWYVGSEGDGTFRWYNGNFGAGTEYMRLSSTGLAVTGALSASGNLNFTGTGNRITGDFSNATFANRVAFQSSTTNGNTGIFILPNGTAGSAAIRCANNSDPTNAAFVGFDSTPTEVRVTSGITGTGTYLPMTFYTGGSERMRIDTSGNTAVTGALSTTQSVTATGGFVIGNDNSFLYDSGTGAVTLRLGASGPYGSFLTNSGEFMVDGPSGTLALGAGGTRVATISSTGLAVTGEVAPSTLRFNRSGGAAWDSNGIRFQIDGTTYSKIGMNDGSNLRISSGLIVDGALSATGIISSTAGGEIPLRISGGGTGAQVLRVQTTGGDYFFGAERSAGNYFIVGSTGYDTIIRGPSGIAFSANNGNNMQMRLSSTGLAVTGALTVASSGNTESSVTSSAGTPAFTLIPSGSGIQPIIAYKTSSGAALRFGTVTGAGLAGFASQMVLDATGLGIGASNPAGKLDIQSASGSGNSVYMRGGTYSDIAYATGIRFLQPASTSNSNRQFRFTSGDSSLTIQGIDGAGTDTSDTKLILQSSGGNVLVGTTSAGTNLKGLQASNTTSTQWPLYTTAVDRGLIVVMSASDGIASYFITNSTTNVGSITCTSTATAYNTASDYRRKSNVQDLTGSCTFIDALKPRTFDWDSGEKGIGFIAHEFAEVSPSSVTGEKDAVDSDGKPVYQAMQASSAEVIANLVAELQSLRQRVAALESK